MAPHIVPEVLISHHVLLSSMNACYEARIDCDCCRR
jgi:hypothetical protein